MDNQDKQSVDTYQTANPQPAVPPAQTPNATDQTDKPKISMSSGEAQALLAVNNLLTPPKSETKPPLKLLIIVIGLIIFAILTSYLVGAFKPGASTKSGSLGLPNQTNPSSGSDVNGQINQDEKTCTNPLNAATVC